MTPDEQRAEQARRVLGHRYEGACPDGIDGWDQRDPECPACIALDAYIEAARRLADVLDLADDVTSYRSGHVGTHYEDCYRHHAGCLAARIQATARGETTSHENRSE